MHATTTLFEQYNLSHHNFIEAYKMINEYVAELYKLPKRLVEDAGNALDSFCVEEEQPNSNVKVKRSCTVVIDFMDQLDDFTMHTIQLFDEHKKHVDETRKYIRMVSACQNKYKGQLALAESKDYIVLTKELNKLLSGLKLIKERADEMVNRLEKLELRWENIKVTMN
jgi:hypothetical protein